MEFPVKVFEFWEAPKRSPSAGRAFVLPRALDLGHISPKHVHLFPSQIFPTGRCCCNIRPSDPPRSRRFQPCLVSSVLCFGASKFDPYLSGWRHGITTYLQDAVKFCWTLEAKCHLRRGNPDVNAGYRMKSLSKNLLVVPFNIWMKLIFRFLDRDLFFYGGHPPKRESEWIIRTMFVHLSSWRKISRGGSHSRRQ